MASTKDLDNYNAFMEEGSRRALPVAPESIPGIQFPERIKTEPRLGIPTILWIHGLAPQGRSNSDPVQVAEQAIQTVASLYRFNRDTLNSAELAYVHDAGKGIAVKFHQNIQGIEVYGASMNVAMDRQLQVHGITGYLFPHDVPTTITFPYPEADALAVAFNDMEGTRFSSAQFEKVGAKDAYQLFGFEAEHARQLVIPSRIKRVLFGMSDRFEAGYYLELNVGSPSSTDSDYFAYIISAETGAILMRKNLTVRDSFTYKVWANESGGRSIFHDGPQGNQGSPHPTGTPDGYQEPFVAPSMMTLESIAPVTDPWLPPGATETVGNNIDAYIDRFGGDGYQPGSGDFRASTTSPGTFDYDFDHGTSPQTQSDSQNAAIVQLFYVNNYLHDVYYEAGFDEVAGNAQDDNFGRGGFDGDVMHCQGQDGSGTNNANMSTPADGASPRMQMYIFSGPTPDRDGTIDNGISSHEWGHYLHHRLIPVTGTTQTSSMSEGWGDFVALLAMVEDGDDLEGVYTTGAYATYHLAFGPPGFVDNFYFGIRRYPYSTDFTKNGLTFRHIGGATSTLPTTPISPQGWENNGNNEVHNAGEIWCTILWEAYHDLIVERQLLGDSFEQIQKDMMHYVVLSLKLSPSQTTFTEAADAMLLAVASTNTDDFSIFADAFARRGIGDGAVAPARNSSSMSGVVESFTPVAATGIISFDSATLDDSIDSCDSDGILDEGETGLLLVSLTNLGYGALSDTTGTVSSPQSLSFSNGGQIVFSSGNPGETLQGTIEVTLDAGTLPDQIQLDFEFADSGTGVSNVNTSASFLTNIDDLPNTSATDDAEHGPNVWERSLTMGNELWRIVEDGTFQSATHAWFVPDITSNLDSYLTTPIMTVNASGDFTFSFYHRFSFESGSWDGGVIELSTDGGSNWVDIGSSATPTYNGTIVQNDASPISNRPAYVNNNPNYPAFEQVTVNLGTQYAGQNVQIRFRIGCDAASGGEGWYIDDIEFPTISPNVFSTRIVEPEVCGITCFASLSEAISGLQQSLGNGEWPETYSILDYLNLFLDNVCPPSP